MRFWILSPPNTCTTTSRKCRRPLDNLRAALCHRTPGHYANRCSWGQYKLLGNGEEVAAAQSPAILCDALSYAGALYLDQGLEPARTFVCNIIAPALEKVLASDSEKDPKSLLQEIAQSQFQITPTYRTVREAGPDHAKEFTVEALIGSKTYG